MRYYYLQYPIRNLWSWQRWEWLEIVNYCRSCLEMPMKQEHLELVIVDYPRNFLYWKLNYKQRWSSSAFPSLPNMFVKVVRIPAIFDDSQLLAHYHWHFHEYPMIQSVYWKHWIIVGATDFMQLSFVWIWKTNAYTQTHMHTCTHTHAGDNLQHNISTEWNILKCAHNFLKCMLCLAYPTIILELKSNTFFGTHGHKEQFYFSKVCSDLTC